MLQLLDSINQNDDYWKDFSINDQDIEFINNYLFENEVPRTAQELTPMLFDSRVKLEKQRVIEKQKERGKTYLPKDEYSVGEKLVFPQLDWTEGKVNAIRPGINPEIGEFLLYFCI